MRKTKDLVIISITSLVLFLLISINVLNKGVMVKADGWIQSVFTVFSDIFLYKVMSLVTKIGDTEAVVIIGLALILLLIYFKHVLWPLFIVVGLTLGNFIKDTLKDLLQIPRPIPYDSFSFPSGHATMITVLFIFVIYSIYYFTKEEKIKKVVDVTSVIVIFLVGFSRIVIGVHWFSDVLGGFLLGIFIGYFTLLSFRIFSKYFLAGRS